MTSTLKLTRAEFKKIFKRPSIFVMAIVLVVSILISFTIFSPAEIVSSTIVYDDAETAKDYYDTFNYPQNINSKSSFDIQIDETKQYALFYNALNENTNLLNDCYNEVLSYINLMINETNITLRDEYRPKLKKSLENFIGAYSSLSLMKDFPTITEITLKKPNYQLYHTEYNYYIKEGSKQLNDFYSYVSDTTNSSNAVVDYYKTNNCQQGLKDVLNNGINFIYTTIKGLVYDFDYFYNSYIILAGNSKLLQMKANRANLLYVIDTLDEYLKVLLNSNYPIILINKDMYLDIKQKIDDAKYILNISETQNNDIVAHSEIMENLGRINILNSLNNLTAYKTSNKQSIIKQVHLNGTTINEFNKIGIKVTENKDKIYSNINDKVNDATITNISREITNYSLLSSTYNQLIVDKTLAYIAKDYDHSVYSKFYGYGFDEYNKYQTSERITTNQYYLDNNVYSNSYITNFSFAQNTGEKTNAMDYMYFTMEICTIIIIVFAMMLVCNLITGETESGTIKLLLVRPFKRSKILTAKLLATIFFVITFMIFSSLICFVGGYFMYGLNNTPILAVLNASTIFEISPSALMIINIISLTIDAIFFVLLALMISIICKNYAASITCSLVLLIANYALNILFGGAFWYTLLPGMNLHLFKYFGNAFTSIIDGTNGIGGVFQSLLITGIESSMTIWFSLFITTAYSLVFLAISYSIFQKRDF